MFQYYNNNHTVFFKELFEYWPHDDCGEYIGPFSGKLISETRKEYWTKRKIKLELVYSITFIACT